MLRPGTGQELWGESREGAQNKFLSCGKDPLYQSQLPCGWPWWAQTLGETPTTPHGGKSLKIEHNNTHGGALQEGNVMHHMGAGACKILKHCFGHSCLMLLIAFIPDCDSHGARISLNTSIVSTHIQLCEGWDDRQ